MNRREKLVVLLRVSPALLIPLRKMVELNAQDPCLNTIEPPVVSLKLVVIFLSLAMVAEHPHFLSDVGIICCHGAPLAASAKVLPGIETEGCRCPHGSGFFPLLSLFGEVKCPVRLASILDHHKAVPLGNAFNRIHLRRLAVEVDRDHALWPSAE